MHGSMRNFIECFDPFVGRASAAAGGRSPGNHEYETPSAAGYFQYFGEAAGEWPILLVPRRRLAGADARTRTSRPAPVRRSTSSCASELTATASTAARWRCGTTRCSRPDRTAPTSSCAICGDLLSRRTAPTSSSLRTIISTSASASRMWTADPTWRGIRQFIAGTGGAQLYDFHRVSGQFAGPHQGARRAAPDPRSERLPVGVHRRHGRECRLGRRRLPLKARPRRLHHRNR